MFEFNEVSAIRIGLASPEQIKSWSHGEVIKAETINYRTLKPERDGLFCERIFGPTKDFECFCGKYKKARYRGIVCDKCGVEVAHSSVRRERMGHINLAAPVTHIWFSKLVPSRLALLLAISPRNLERVIYFSHYIIISVNEEAKKEKVRQVKEAAEQYMVAREEEVTREIEEHQSRSNVSGEGEEEVKEVNQLRADFIEAKEKHNEDLKIKVATVERLQPKQLLTEEEYQEFSEEYDDVFEAGIGAEAILELLKQIDVEALYQEILTEMKTASGLQYKKIVKRLQIVNAFRRSGSKPEWMILTTLPVSPPALRPVVSLEGGRFAISDLNDLYRRVINRNNRLRRLMSLGAPEVIVRNEKRMLQEAVDALIDNGRRGRPVTAGSSNHELKSLSDMLRGKQGRFRQNLLGKRVDYSGRSVIVSGPQLKLHQCGLPRHVALELFKPFVMHKLIEKGYANNIKSARRQVERAEGEVWDILGDLVKERPVLLNRAPTLHRLSVQAFEPVLIDGNAFQLHPLVCTAFNADFDGDQMAVHVPLSRAAVKEAREQMLSIHNMLLPSNGSPVMAPTLDMVIGCYYLTSIKAGAVGEKKKFGSFAEAKLAYEFGRVALGAEIEVRSDGVSRQKIETTVGRILFNEALPPQLRFYNEVVDKGILRELAAKAARILDDTTAAATLDSLKQLGFEYATKSGVSIAMSDIEVPEGKKERLKQAEERVILVEDEFNRGLITEGERYNGVVQIWTEVTEQITEEMIMSMDRQGAIYMMATSGARGNFAQIRQMAGMRGLMADPSGKIIEVPIRSSFREGLTPMEYFISTHGARKGLADTALRTSDSGYLTRRLVDVAQDVSITENDCGTTDGVWILRPENDLLPSFEERIVEYLAAREVADPQTGEIIVSRDEEIDEEKARRIASTGVTQVYVRSPLSCRSKFGICQKCYGIDLSKRQLVQEGISVGIIAAQSIGEPGTQLTLRTFHTGGVAGKDITSGLPRVEELFEAKTPKNTALISEIDGTVEIEENEAERVIRICHPEFYLDEYPLPAGASLVVKEGEAVDIGAPLFSVQSDDLAENLPVVVEEGQLPAVARISGKVIVGEDSLCIQYEDTNERRYRVSPGVRLLVKAGGEVRAGEQLTEGIIDPQDILHVLGKEAVQQYLIDGVQKVYRFQGVTIHDKHIAIIIRQLLNRVKIVSSGDTEFLPGEMVDFSDYDDVNTGVLVEGGEPATAQPVLLGMTKASLNKYSWLAAASFQETSHVLVDAAIRGKVDRLRGLKENVILGKLLPSCVTARKKMIAELEKRVLGEAEEEAAAAESIMLDTPSSAAQDTPDTSMV